MKIHTFNGKKNICGNHIKEARIAKKMSQSDLAVKLQVEGIVIERDSISRMELGRRFVTDYELKILARILDVDIEWLIQD